MYSPIHKVCRNVGYLAYPRARKAQSQRVTLHSIRAHMLPVPAEKRHNHEPQREAGGLRAQTAGRHTARPDAECDVEGASPSSVPQDSAPTDPGSAFTRQIAGREANSPPPGSEIRAMKLRCAIAPLFSSCVMHRTSVPPTKDRGECTTGEF